MSEAETLRERHLDASAAVAETCDHLEKLRPVLTKHAEEEADAKAQAKRGELSVEDLVTVQARRKATEELIAELEADQRRLEAERADLEAQLDREQAIEAIDELAAEGATLKAAYDAELRAVADELRQRMKKIARQHRKLERHRDATIAALRVFGVSEHPHSADENDQLLGELQERGVDRHAILEWPRDLSTSRLVRPWAPPALEDAVSVRADPNVQPSTTDQNLAAVLLDLQLLARRADATEGRT